MGKEFWQTHYRLGVTRLAAFRVQIRERIGRRDSANEPRVVPECSNDINVMQRCRAIWPTCGRDIISRIESQNDGVIGRRCRHRCKRRCERLCTKLRSTASAHHLRLVVTRAHGGKLGECRARPSRFIQHLETIHEASIDPILQPKDGRTCEGAAPFASECSAVPQVE